MDHTPAICTHVALEFQGSGPSAKWPEPLRPGCFVEVQAVWSCRGRLAALATSNSWADTCKDFYASLTFLSWSKLDHTTKIVLPPASAI